MSKYDDALHTLRSEWLTASALGRETLLSDLRQKGFSISDAIRLLRVGAELSLGEAKQFVSESGAWVPQVRSAQGLHDDAWRVLEEFVVAPGKRSL